MAKRNAAKAIETKATSTANGASLAEAKATAARAVLAFAAHHGDAEVALMGAYLLTGHGSDDAAHFAYCAREVSRVIAKHFDLITDGANEKGEGARAVLVAGLAEAGEVLRALHVAASVGAL